MRTLFKILLFCLALFGIERFCHHQTFGFALKNIYSERDYGIQSPMQDIDPSVFSQPFFLFAHGLECYAFVSEDQQFVLKFFKHHHVREAELLHKLFPVSSTAELVRAKEKRLVDGMASINLAYNELKEETGLVFVHLQKTQGKLPLVTLVDTSQIRHTVKLDDVHFVLQKKAELVASTFERLDHKKRQECLSSLVRLVARRAKKGISDRDPTLMRNYGFVGTHAIIIDTGSFSKNTFLQEKQAAGRTLFYETLPLRCFLHKNYPELMPHFEQEFHALINQ